MYIVYLALIALDNYFFKLLFLQCTVYSWIPRLIKVNSESKSENNWSTKLCSYPHRPLPTHYYPPQNASAVSQETAMSLGLWSANSPRRFLPGESVGGGVVWRAGTTRIAAMLVPNGAEVGWWQAGPKLFWLRAKEAGAGEASADGVKKIHWPPSFWNKTCEI